MRFRVVVEVNGQRQTKIVELDPEKLVRSHVRKQVGGSCDILEVVWEDRPAEAAPAQQPTVIYAGGGRGPWIPPHARRTSSFSKLCLLASWIGMAAGAGLVIAGLRMEHAGFFGVGVFMAPISFLFWICVLISRWWTYD